MPYDPKNCVVGASCPKGSSLVYPGKWEIPMYNLLTTTGLVWVSMDPDTPSVTSIDQALANIKYSFQQHYASKLPFGLYQHMAQYIAYTPDIEARKIKMMTDFMSWAMSTYPDVWFVTNQQLINWIQTPVPSSKMQDFLPCVMPATDASNPEICDGIDNTGSGVGDTPLLSFCTFPLSVGGSFNSCFGCPSIQPNYTLPLPPRSGTTASAPDQGCPGLQSWAPDKALCLTLNRLPSLLPNGNQLGVGNTVKDVNQGVYSTPDSSIGENDSSKVNGKSSSNAMLVQLSMICGMIGILLILV